MDRLAHVVRHVLLDQPTDAASARQGLCQYAMVRGSGAIGELLPTAAKSSMDASPAPRAAASVPSHKQSKLTQYRFREGVRGMAVSGRLDGPTEDALRVGPSCNEKESDPCY